MNLWEALVWQPGGFYRSLMMTAGVALVMAIGYLHMVSGLAYEFHAIFIIPVLTVSWFLGRNFGYALAVMATVEWFMIDLMLGGDQLSLPPLLFNSAIRLAIFATGAWLISEIHRVLVRESRLAREDALTQLPNRREFEERGLQAFAQAQRQGSPFTAVFIDLDRFKEVNDEQGHEAGDRLLMAVATVIRSHVRVSDIPGRLGGDEFALLLPNMKADAARAYVEKLRRCLLDAMQAERWPVTFSIGVASYCVMPQHFDTLVQQADALMYEVKGGGRNGILLREH